LSHYYSYSNFVNWWNSVLYSFFFPLLYKIQVSYMADTSFYSSLFWGLIPWSLSFPNIDIFQQCMCYPHFFNRMFLISDLSFISLLLVSGLTFSAGILHRWWCVLRESHLVLHDVHLPSLIMFILISCSRQCPNNQCSSLLSWINSFNIYLLSAKRYHCK